MKFSKLGESAQSHTSGRDKGKGSTPNPADSEGSSDLKHSCSIIILGHVGLGPGTICLQFVT